MRENCMYGSVRGARGNSRPYRDVVIVQKIVCSITVRYPNWRLAWPTTCHATVEVRRKL